MTPHGFLQKIWPAQGLYCIATPNETKGFRHRVFSTIAEAVSFAEELNAAKRNVFFAVGTLREPRVWNEKLEKYQVRVKSNIEALKAFFIDVDVDPSDTDERRHYSSQAHALAAVRAFAQYVSWPKPTIVSSGYGLHVYWTLTTPITAAMHAEVNQVLKNVSQDVGLKLDTQALDVSRVLRVLGTDNHKRQPAAPTRLLVEGGDSDPRALYRSLKAVAAQNPRPVRSQERWEVPGYLDAFGADSNLRPHDDVPPDFARIGSKCQALQQFQEARGAVSYPYWLHSLQVIRLCANGAALAHDLSSGAENYSAETTDKFLADLAAKDIGPTLCTTFEHDAPEACSRCPLRGKITSPIVLGRPQVEKVAVGTTVVVEAATATLRQVVPPPAPYKRVAGEGIFVRTTNKDGDEYDKKIHGYDLYPVTRVYNERDDREYVRWVAVTPTDGEIAVEFPASALFDSREFTTILANAGVYLDPDKNIISEVRSYMVAYVQTLQRHAAREQLYSRMGWRGEGEQAVFVVGQRMFDQGQEFTAQTDRDNAVAQHLRSVGTLEGWQTAVQALNHADFRQHQFVLATAFGAPLMRYTHQAGAVLHLYGASGRGKSALQRLVNSVWGHPSALMLPADPTSSTQNARMMFLSLMNTLPVCADEITAIAPEDLTSLTYAISLGEEKFRATRTGDIRKRLGSWSTILLSSANASLHQRLMGTIGADATTLRIVELGVASVPHYSRATFEERVEIPILDNYGVAGPVYARHLTTIGHTALHERVQRTIRELDAAVGAKAEERVWSALMGANIAGIEIAAEIGLVPFDTQAIRRFCRTAFLSLRGAVQSAAESAATTLATYLNESISHTLVLGDLVRIPGTRASEPIILREPVSRLEVRIETETQRAYVALGAFRAWLGRRGQIASPLLDELLQTSVATSVNAQRSLGLGTRYAAGQVRCMEIDLTHTALVGVRSPLVEARSSASRVVSINPPERKAS